MITPTRLTDAANTISADNGQPLTGIEVEYPNCSPFSKSNRWMLLKEFSYFGLYDVASKTRVRPLLQVDSSSEPRWSINDPDVLYFHKSNKLMLYNVQQDTSSTVKTFTEYQTISAKGESEIGEDGDSLVLAGDGREIFVYRISNSTKSKVLRSTGWDSITLSPDGKVLVSAQEINLFSPSMAYLRKLTRANGHRHVARDQAGKEFLIWDNSNEPVPRSFDGHAIVKIDLETGQQSKLMDLGWNWATHITAPMGPLGWCIVSTYDNQTGGDLWKVWLDGKAPEHLLAHGSDSSTYEGQPHASVSRDGNLIAYNVKQGSTTNVYLAELESAVIEVPVTAPLVLTWHLFPNQAPLTSANFPAKPGQAGFCYDGGADVKILFNDGPHKWFIPMKLLN